MKVKLHSQLNSESCISLVNGNWSLANPKHASRWKSLLPNMPNLSFRRLEPVPTGVAHPACHEQRLLIFKSQCQHVDSVCLLVYKDKHAAMQLSWQKQTKCFWQQHRRHKESTVQSDLLFLNKTQPLTNDRCTSIGVALFVGKMNATDCTKNK